MSKQDNINKILAKNDSFNLLSARLGINIGTLASNSAIDDNLNDRVNTTQASYRPGLDLAVNGGLN